MPFKKIILLTCFAWSSVAVASQPISSNIASSSSSKSTDIVHKSNSSRTVFMPPECVPGGGKEPAWADAEIRQQPWYQAWLTTTATLCVNLKNALTDNENHENYHVDAIVWRTDQRWLFRSVSGVYNPIENVFKHGLLPRMPNGGNLKIRPGMPANSGITSSAYGPASTLGFGDHLYILDTPGGGIAVEESIGEILGTGEDEVAFPGGVKAANIKGVLVRKNGGMSYSANPNYVDYKIVAPGSVELIAAASGVAGQQIVIDVNGERNDNGVHRFSDKAVKTITAIDRRTGKPRDVTWWVNGLMNADPEPSSCLELPAALQVDRQILLDVGTGYNSDQAVVIPSVNHTCARFRAFPIRDGNLLQEKVVNAMAHLKAAGETFGGWRATQPVRLMASFVLGMGRDAQAVDLHAQVDWLGAPGVPGGFEQDIYILRGQELRIAFRAGKNSFSRCALDSRQSPFFKGDQTFKVQIVNPDDEVVMEKTINLGVATELRKTGYMNPEWQTESIRYLNNARNEDFRLRFVSTSEEGKACGAMITNVEAWDQD